MTEPVLSRNFDRPEARTLQTSAPVLSGRSGYVIPPGRTGVPPVTTRSTKVHSLHKVAG